MPAENDDTTPGTPDRERTAGETDGDEGLPEAVRAEAKRLTRLAREAVDESEAEAYRTHRDDLLADHGYRARVRDDDEVFTVGPGSDTGTGETLVCYPEEWVEDGTVRPDRIDDLDRAVELSLSGAGAPEKWEETDAHNREVVAAVREAHGEAHGENVAALADFLGNHYAKRIEDATAGELREFLTEYYPRNAWPSEEAKSVVETSLCLVCEETGARVPRFLQDE